MAMQTQCQQTKGDLTEASFLGLGLLETSHIGFSFLVRLLWDLRCKGYLGMVPQGGPEAELPGGPSQGKKGTWDTCWQAAGM